MVFRKTFISMLHQVMTDLHPAFEQWMKLLSLISCCLWRPTLEMNTCGQLPGNWQIWLLKRIKMSQMSFTMAVDWPKAENYSIVNGQPLRYCPEVVCYNKDTSYWKRYIYIDRLVQERCNSIVLAMELRLSYTNPSIWYTNSNISYISMRNAQSNFLFL